MALVADTLEGKTHGRTVGDRLRVAREGKGLTLQELALQTRIPIRHLEHIERGEWDSLPAATYSVGFARSYAQAVGLDPSDVGGEVRQQLGMSRSATGPVTAQYEPADPARVPPRSIALIAAGIAVVLIIAFIIWRSNAVDDPTPEPQILEAPAPAPKAAAPRAQQPQAPIAANGPVVLTATEDVWMRIDNANGGPALYQGTLKAGERYEVPAAAPAPQIRTGRPQSLRVTVGQTIIPPLGDPDRTISRVSLRAADLIARAQGSAPAGGAMAPAAGPVAAAPGQVPAR
ncbi:helix-turn-helix domain-containing protein [Sphingomonas parva]|uniref:Helix-turn-helix domain-containing protein n=1 Tax=Sphingomonas parva TaxID=2555898 RepID=A0A4Y8ZT14_9SPHN|nr:RodZ domain-containing protein [Sphingomonas parva]TFI59153.1 helix-turn-helix domain-containing protein [Sphingomonas parva]